jgi:hypothetical protein
LSLRHEQIDVRLHALASLIRGDAVETRASIFLVIHDGFLPKN